jgi:hypothetical protein
MSEWFVVYVQDAVLKNKSKHFIETQTKMSSRKVGTELCTPKCAIAQLRLGTDVKLRTSCGCSLVVSWEV